MDDNKTRSQDVNCAVKRYRTSAFNGGQEAGVLCRDSAESGGAGKPGELVIFGVHVISENISSGKFKLNVGGVDGAVGIGILFDFEIYGGG